MKVSRLQRLRATELILFVLLYLDQIKCARFEPNKLSNSHEALVVYLYSMQTEQIVEYTDACAVCTENVFRTARRRNVEKKWAPRTCKQQSCLRSLERGGCEDNLNRVQFCTACTLHERVRNSVAHPNTQLRPWTPTPSRMLKLKPTKEKHTMPRGRWCQIHITAM